MSFWRHRFDQKTIENIVRISALKVFIASLGLPGSFWGLPVGFLIYCLLTKYLGSPQEATKKFRAEILKIFSLLFRSKR